MSLTIRLLGAPCLERDRAPVAGPRGYKAWALLAYLMLSRGRPSRQRLAELFFAETDDPLGSLRWNLAELRRGLGQPDALGGDPVDLDILIRQADEALYRAKADGRNTARVAKPDVI